MWDELVVFRSSSSLMGVDSLRVKREVACVWLMMQLLVMS
jgi:hypothetical protein